jgi:DNA-directed RNA polymerase specialized sigma24 family protein
MVELVDHGAGAATPWPAAVLRSRLRDRLKTAVRRHRRQRHREGAPVDHASHPVTVLHDAHSAEERMARVIVAAAHGGDLTVTAAQTVLATTVYGWDTTGFAALTGRDVRAVRTHRRRTERRLAALATLAAAG